nr:sugar phosphate isomerase/epimerase family protein [uncultured Caproiciproducens sp.]
MYKRKIGVIIDSFRCGIHEGVKKAKDVGAEGIQIYAVKGEMTPENINASSRKELLDYIKSNGLVVSALCGDMGGGFVNAKDNAKKIEKSKRIMELAKDLETNVVTTHIGVVPQDMENPRFKILQEACEQLGEFADNIGAYFAIETGPEKSSVLKSFLGSLKCKSVKVNLDPANLVMVSGDNAAEAVYNLKDYIVHTHAKDGIMYKPFNPENFYGENKEPDFTKWEDYFDEVPLGLGKVDFKSYVNALDDIGYKGYLTIEREVGDNPERDITEAIKFLRAL